MTALRGATRRSLLAAALLSAAPLRARAAAAATPRQPVSFEVWRNGRRIGVHTVSFRGDDRGFTADIVAQIAIKVGPLTLFQYEHRAEETWREGRFAELHSRTTSNGFTQQVSAVATPQGVTIAAGRGQATAPRGTHPLTHWNPAVLEGPLFNPQSGAPVREKVVREEDRGFALPDGRTGSALRYNLAGDVEITDWYVQDVWSALRGKVQDGSYVEYRRA